MVKSEMKTLLDEREDLQDLLFPRGHFLTDDDAVDAHMYPFYSRWNSTRFGGFRFLVHPHQKLYTCWTKSTGIALVGHAFNPLDSECNTVERDLLEKALALYEENEVKFIDYFNQWTGNFVLYICRDHNLQIYGDPAGMQMVFYGSHHNKIYCSSHTKLLGDICDLSFDPYIERLINYRFYPLLGNSLPGDLSPYSQFKRLIPNHFVQLQRGVWSTCRFFPTKDNALVDMPYGQIIDLSAEILKKTMEIIPRKWNRPAISLTGGCDSKTTLSCTNGQYDQYGYFSYCSSSSEAVDAEAASQICGLLKLPHRIYQISDTDAAFADCDNIRMIMDYNSGCIGNSNANDVRKRAFFLKTDDFDVEVKSWVSEIARAYYHKRFARKSFPKTLTPQYARSLYKVFVTDRKLIRETDLVFEEFLSKYYSDNSFNLIPWYDLFFWEFRMSSWNGLVITGEHQIAYNITIPYNNRVLLQLLLSTPVEKRIQDEPHWDIMRKMNPEIADCGISVVNVKHTTKRAKLECMYLNIMSKQLF